MLNNFCHPRFKVNFEKLKMDLNFQKLPIFIINAGGPDFSDLTEVSQSNWGNNFASKQINDLSILSCQSVIAN